MAGLLQLRAAMAVLLTVTCAAVLCTNQKAVAASQTVTCNVAGFDNPGGNTLLYDHSAGSCTLGTGFGLVSSAAYDISFINQNGGSEQFRIGTGGAVSLTAHNGCTLGSFTAAAGVSCTSTRNGVGTETGTVTIDGPNGGTIRMTITYTVAGEQNFAYNSASVTITTPDSASSSNTAARQAVLASASRSQSVVIGQNFSARVASLSAPGTSVPSSASTLPNATANSTTRPSDNRVTQPINLGQSLSVGQDPLWDAIHPRDEGYAYAYESRGGGLRELALLASFDTSQFAGLVPDTDVRSDGTRQRATLGGQGKRLTLWGHGSFTGIENTRNRAGEDNRHDGDVWGYNLGADYRITSTLVAGLSVGYARTDIVTTFESGSYQEDSWSLSPYLIYRPNDTLTFSAIGGYGMGDVERERDAGITGSTDSDVWFLQMDARQAFAPIAESPLRFTAGLGVLLSRSRLEGYRESDGSIVADTRVDTARLRPSGEFSYGFVVQTATATPYLRAEYLHDFTDRTNGDAGAFDLGGGIRIASGSTGWSGLIEGRRMVGRADYEEFGFGGLIAYGLEIGQDAEGEAGIASPYMRADMSRSGAPMMGAGLTYSASGGAMGGSLDLSRDMDNADMVSMLRLRLRY